MTREFGVTHKLYQDTVHVSVNSPALKFHRGYGKEQICSERNGLRFGF